MGIRVTAERAYADVLLLIRPKSGRSRRLVGARWRILEFLWLCDTVSRGTPKTRNQFKDVGDDRGGHDLLVFCCSKRKTS